VSAPDGTCCQAALSVASGALALWPLLLSLPPGAT